MLLLAEICGILICKQTIDSLMLEILHDTHARIWPLEASRPCHEGVYIIFIHFPGIATSAALLSSFVTIWSCVEAVFHHADSSNE